jgi:co-chaperonin GroES (HSP10)
MRIVNSIIEISELKMVRNNVLVVLPAWTDQYVREQNGLALNTLSAIKFDPCRGLVVAQGPDATNVRIHDEVFFNKMLWMQAKEAAFDQDDERYTGNYVGHRVYGVLVNESEKMFYYMIIPEDQLWLKESVGSITPLNEHLIAAPVEKDAQRGDLIIADLKPENYKINFAKIVVTKSYWLNDGDTVQTLRHCDLFIEEPLDNPVLPSEWFIIEEENIVSKLSSMNKYHAGPKRIVVQADKIESLQDNGLINTEHERYKLITGTVISTGVQSYSASKGDKVVYARNSGMKLPPIDEQIDYEVILDTDVFAVIKNEPDWKALADNASATATFPIK